MTHRTFAADAAVDRRDDALIALVDEGLSAYEISALRVGDVRLFDYSATVRLVCDGGDRFVRVTREDNVRDLRCYVERDVSMRRSAPLFPGRSPIRGMSVSRLYNLLRKLREPEVRRERA
ncbi:MAG: hypothetical protein NUV72_08510 [Bauldia sp.]|nr:hypothetical protein [Bauldia sp.]